MKRAVIILAPSVSDETYSYILSGLKKKFGEDLDVTKYVKSDLIGGFVLAVNGQIYDVSVKTQLRSIEKDLKQ